MLDAYGMYKVEYVREMWRLKVVRSAEKPDLRALRQLERPVKTKRETKAGRGEENREPRGSEGPKDAENESEPWTAETTAMSPVNSPSKNW